MKKHMLTKHEDHQSKECQHNSPTFMELLKHVAMNHFEEDITEEKNHSLKEKEKVSDTLLEELEDLLKK